MCILPHISNLSTKHHTLHQSIVKLLINSFNVTHSCYSSTLTCPSQLIQYKSLHTMDVLFKSTWLAKSSNWSSKGLTYPIDHQNTLEAIHWARIEAKEYPPRYNPHHKPQWLATQALPLKLQADIHMLTKSLHNHTYMHSHPNGQNITNIRKPSSHPLYASRTNKTF